MTSSLPDWTPEALVERLASFGAAPALIAVRDDTTEQLSYAALSEKVRSLAAGLAASGLRPGELVALIAPNGADWVVARFALAAMGAVAVALDDLSSEAELGAALADSGCRHALASAPHAATLRSIDPYLDVVVIGGGAAPEGTRAWQELFIAPDAAALTRPLDGPALLAYTSGTTGAPKGFLLSYANLWASLQPLASSGLVGGADRVLLPLPLHHIYPLLVGLLTPLSLGAAVVFPEAISGPRLVQALRVAEVSAIVGVPGLYAALASGIAEQVARRGGLVRAIFQALLAASIAIRRLAGIDAGRWLFRRIRAGVGPKLRLLVSGGAHLDPETLWPLVGLGFEVRTGYGLAETSSIFTGNLPGAERLESEGKPFPGGAMRIAEPDEEGIGDIELRGPGVFAGYRNPAANRDAFCADGWFRTGDLGRIDDDGFLFVTGRRKETIVLGGGKKVNPEALERLYGSSPYIRELAVLEHRGSLVALVRPDWDAARTGPSARIDDTIRVALASRSQNLPSYERLAGVALVREPLPRTRLGKYRRFLLPALYERSLSGEALPPPRAPEPEDAALLADPRARRLHDLLRARYGTRKFSLDAHPQLDLGIDSLEWVSLSLALEQVGLALSETGFAAAVTVRDLLRAVQQGAAAPQAEEQPDVERRWLAPAGRGVRALGFLVYLLDWLLMRVLFRLSVAGTENLPPAGPCLLVANHASDLDGLAIVAALGYRRAQRLYWAGDAVRLFRRPWLEPLWRALHVFPADDRQPARTLALAEAVLAHGYDLAWFPEGWRTPDGRLQRFLPGIGRILARTRVPAIPIHVSGSFEAMPRDRRIPRFKALRVVVGPPIDSAALLRALPDDETGHQRIADRLHDIVEALPSHERGHAPPPA